MKYFLLLFLLLCRETKAETQVDSMVLQDLVANYFTVVDVAKSNSDGCKKPCTVQRYLAFHLGAMAREIEKAKKGGSYRSFFKGACSSEGKPRDTLTTCRLQLGFELGEEAWSETLVYEKSSDTGSVLPKSFRATGTP